MTNRLFRREVANAKNDDWLGSISLVSPVSHWVFTILGILIALIAGMIIVFGHFTRIQAIPGTLISSSGIITIVAPYPCIITEIFVQPGDKVTKGQALFQILEIRPATSSDSPTIITAPYSEVISNVLVESGARLASDDPVISGYLSNARLEAQLLIPSKDIGFIYPGERLFLHYDAFPYQMFGAYYGTVATVSLSALSPIELTYLHISNSDLPLYRATVSLDRETVEAYGKSVDLRPGIGVTAVIPLDRHTLLQWAFAPLYEATRNNITKKSSRLEGS